MALMMYGIRNCDTVRKARGWLDDRGIAYDFHDYKTMGIGEARLVAWADEVGWERLLNRSGTTFRTLPDADKAGIDRERALRLMAEQPSLIRRPVLEGAGALLVGFREEAYAAALG